MRRVYILILFVFVLVFSAFAVSFGWYYNLKHQIGNLITAPEEQDNEKVAVQEPEQKAEMPAVPKKAVVTIGERAAYRKPSGAQVVVAIVNEGAYAGSAKIYAELLYSQRAVANNSVLIESISPGEKRNVTINIQYFKQWNSFDVRQI